MISTCFIVTIAHQTFCPTDFYKLHETYLQITDSKSLVFTLTKRARDTICKFPERKRFAAGMVSL